MSVILWDAFRRGDDEAFSSLFDMYVDPLYKYGMKFVADEDFIKDTIQDLFINLYNKENLSMVDNPQFYLCRALKNLILNRIVKEKQMPTISIQELPFMVEYEMTGNEEDTTEEDGEIIEKVKQIIEQLPPRQQEAIYLRFNLEMSYEEISEILDMNYQSARNLIHRAVKKIRENMELGVFLLFIF